MPVVRIDMYKGFSNKYKAAVFTALHNALVTAFKIPEYDRNQIINEHDESDFERSPNKTKQFIVVEITAFKGRTREAKRTLYKEIVEGLGRDPGIKPADILITINEPELVNWGLAGVCADEAEIGFKIEV